MQREVVVVEQAALHLLLVRLHLQMAYSRFRMFLVVRFPWRKGNEGRLVRVEGVLGVRLASAAGCRLLRRFLRKGEIPLLERSDGLHCTGGEHFAQPRTVRMSSHGSPRFFFIK